MVGSADEVGPLTDGQVIADVGLIDGVGEVLQLVFHIVGEEVGGDDLHPLEARLPVELVDVLQAHHLEEVGGLGDALIVLGQHPLGEAVHHVAAVPLEAELDDGGLVHAVGGEDVAAGLEDPLGLPEDRQLVRFVVKVVEGAEEEHRVEALVGVAAQVQGVALLHGDVGPLRQVGAEDLDVVLHQLQGVDIVAVHGEGDGVDAGTGPHV